MTAIHPWGNENAEQSRSAGRAPALIAPEVRLMKRERPSRDIRWFRNWGWAAFLALAVGLATGGGSAAWAGTRQQAVVLLLDRVSWYELTHSRMPNLQKLLGQGAVGLMNSRAPGDWFYRGVWVTLGAGRPARGGPEVWPAVEVWQMARGKDLNSGGSASIEQGILHLGAAGLKWRNQVAATEAVPGLMGGVIRRSGRMTAVIGNSDTLDLHRRQAVALAMDESGLVDIGEVGERVLVRAGEGWQTDLEQMIRYFQICLQNADFVVVDFGDTMRADFWSPPDRLFYLSAAKRRALDRADRLLGELLSLVDLGRTLVIVVAPTCPAYPISHWRTPGVIVMAGHGIAPGLLTSASTRRKGLISNADFAPTILNWLGLPVPSAMSGHPARVVADQDSVPVITGLDKKMTLTYDLRCPLGRTLVFFQSGVVVVLWVLFFWPSFASRLVRPLIRGFATVALGLPLLFLMLPLFSPQTPFQYSLWAAAGVIGLGMVGWVVRSPFGVLATICLATSLTLLGDTLAGGHLIGSSILGHDPIIGGRFYGIGNECMGTLIVAAILAILGVMQMSPAGWRVPLWLVALWFGVVAIAIGAPFWGANLGGTITAAVGLSAACFLFRGRGITWRSMLTILAITLVAGGLVVALGIISPAGESHIGQAVRSLQAKGPQVGLTIIDRKLDMNLRLIRFSNWNLLFAVVMASAIIFLTKPRGILERCFSAYPRVREGMIGIVVVAIVALLVNDTGIMASAAAIGMGISGLLLICASAGDTYHENPCA